MIGTCPSCEAPDVPLEDAWASCPWRHEPRWLCAACLEHARESAHEASLAAFYGASTPQTDAERQAAALVGRKGMR